MLWRDQLGLISKSLTYCVALATLCVCCFTCKMGTILVSTSRVAAELKRDNRHMQQIAQARPIVVPSIWKLLNAFLLLYFLELFKISERLFFLGKIETK